ncbi:MAG: hypothetical protein ACE5LX_09890 [Nitrospinota bacterium]
MKGKWLLILAGLAFLGFVFFSYGWRGEDFAGVDVKVVEKYAREMGRPPRKPLLDTSRGDLLLFLFTLSGAAGGFIGGYLWRKEIHEKSEGGASN